MQDCRTEALIINVSLKRAKIFLLENENLSLKYIVSGTYKNICAIFYRLAMQNSPYIELHCHSNYSFLEGASWIYELLSRSTELGYSALAITDHNNLCGAMEF